MSVTSSLPSHVTPREAAASPYRVMVVDDSAVIRGLLSRWLDTHEAIKVVGTASNGEMALKRMRETEPEAIVLDIEMPIMDGLTALPKLLEQDPDVKVLMASTLTLRNAEVSLKALAMGAADYLSKPESNRGVASSEEFKLDLIRKVIELIEARRKVKGEPLYQPEQRDDKPLVQNSVKKKIYQGKIQLRPFNRIYPKALAIGSSTGGPQALMAFLTGIKAPLTVPIFITQHMPATFTSILAKHLSQASGLDCKEAEHGEPVQAGTVYIAPGDYHMVIDSEEGQPVISLNQGVMENFCRPAVDPMLRSIVKHYGNNVLCAILTGMGQDGLLGAQQIVEAGGNVIAQDEESSVVWGMPGAVATNGVCSAVLPLEQLTDKLSLYMSGVWS